MESREDSPGDEKHDESNMGARVWIGFRERPPLLTDGVFEGTYAFNV